MQNIQEIFTRIQEAKKKMKDLKASYKDALETSQEYQETTESLKTMREKKKQIETTIKDQFATELTRMDDLKIDVASDMELLSDVALSQFMKGEPIEIKDEYDNSYEPVFKVNFKKI